MTRDHEGQAARQPRAGTLVAGPWSEEGIAPLLATGSDVRAALEAALRGILDLITGDAGAQSGETRSAPMRGEGDDLAALFADLAEDFLAQSDLFGAGLEAVTVDGVVRRQDGGFVAWGIASGALDGEPIARLPRLCDSLTVADAGEDAGEGRVVVRARLCRP